MAATYHAVTAVDRHATEYIKHGERGRPPEAGLAADWWHRRLSDSERAAFDGWEDFWVAVCIAVKGRAA